MAKRTKKKGLARTPPYEHFPEWSTAKFWGYIRSTLRRSWLRWPPRYRVLADAKEVSDEPRFKWKYRCAVCNATYPMKNVEVDHITPCGSLKNVDDIGGFVTRMFVDVDKLRVVCKPCHQAKTAEDRQ